MDRNICVVLIVFGVLLAFGAFVQHMQKNQPPKKIEFYMNEPLNVAGIDITVTDVKETKQIKKIKAKNTFLQTFVTVKNTTSARNYLPFTIALIHRQDDNWICLLDERFKNKSDKTEYVAGGFMLEPLQEAKAQIIFNCDAYLNDKAGARKSKPSDFKFFINSKEKKEGGYIFLENKK